MSIIFEPIPKWQENGLDALVDTCLRRLRIRGSLDGFIFLRDAIRQTVCDPGRIRYITKDLYPDLAKEHGTKAYRVERSMRTAILHCWKGGGRETLDEMAGYHLTERPTVSQFIDLVAAYIRHRH